MTVICWVVDSKNAVYGPFISAREAGQHVQDYHGDMAGPVVIKPVMKPLQRPPREISIEERQALDNA